MSVMDIFDISGRKALVTGSARGIGKVLALTLAEAGCDVSLVGLHFEGVQLSSRHRAGLAVRFPRIARWRTDKLPKDADTLEIMRYGGWKRNSMRPGATVWR